MVHLGHMIHLDYSTKGTFGILGSLGSFGTFAVNDLQSDDNHLIITSLQCLSIAFINSAIF